MVATLIAGHFPFFSLLDISVLLSHSWLIRNPLSTVKGLVEVPKIRLLALHLTRTLLPVEHLQMTALQAWMRWKRLASASLSLL